MLNKGLIVSSPTCEKDKTQTSLIYIATILNKLGIQFGLLDLSGRIDYFDPPHEFFSPCDSEYWLSPRVFHEASWLDNYLPSDPAKFDAVFYSALFSPDILIHGRHSINQKKHHPECKTIIGGAAISCLNDIQLRILSEIFDYVCIGYDVEHLITNVIEDIKKSGTNSIGKCIKTKGFEKIQPNYKLVAIKPFITVYSGHGCNWGKCRFCNTANLYGQQYHCRPAMEIAHDFERISQLNGNINDVMLSSDSFTKKDLIKLISFLKQAGSKVPYNLMLRGEKWISEKIGKSLRDSGCTDVFLGAESLNDGVLRILNKGITTKNIIGAAKNLSKYVKVIIGLILFIPHATKRHLENQIINLEKILPYVHVVEPEILSIVQGTEFAMHHQRFGIKLWAKERTINDSWCYGFSPDIPWSFVNENEAELWFRHYDELRTLLGDFVQPYYWDSIDHVRLRF